MSTMGILAKGMAGALKGGDVLAKGEAESRETMWWDHKTEVARKNNLESMTERHNLESDTGWRNKEGGVVNKRDLNSYRNAAKKKGVPFEEYMSSAGYKSQAKYGETAKREAAIAGADEDFEQLMKTKDWKERGLSKEEVVQFQESFRNAAVKRLTATGKGLTADQFLGHYEKMRTAMIDPEKGGQPYEMWEAEAKENGMDVQAYINQKAMESVTQAAQSHSNMSKSMEEQMAVIADTNRASDSIEKAIKMGKTDSDKVKLGNELKQKYQQYPQIVSMIDAKLAKITQLAPEDVTKLRREEEPTAAMREAEEKKDSILDRKTKRAAWEERVIAKHGASVLEGD